MDNIFINILNISISASWLVGAIVIFRFLFKKAPKWLTVALWALVAIRLICPFSFESELSLVPAKETIPHEILSIDPHEGAESTTFEVISNPVYSGFTKSEITVDSVGSFQIDFAVLALVWLCGMGAMVLYAFLSYLRIYLKVRQSINIRENIFICDRINTPFIFGIIKPKIYIPSDMGEKDMSFVIAHEKAHLKRKDYFWKPFGFLLLTVYWFNPVMWLAYILLCKDIELACDEKVIKEMGADYKKSYSMALINCSVPKKMITACPVAFGEVGVKQRIKAVLNYKKPALWLIILSLVIATAVAVCFMTEPEGDTEYKEYYDPGYALQIVVETYKGTTQLPDKTENFTFDVLNGTKGELPNGTKFEISECNLQEGSLTVKLTGTELFPVAQVNPKQSKEITVCEGSEGIELTDENYMHFLTFSFVQTTSSIDEAVSKAILDLNSKGRWSGECPAEGHIIFGTKENGNAVTVYMLEQFSSYGFVDGWFISVGGHSIPCVMMFEKKDGQYTFMDVEYAQDGSNYTKSIKRMFPKIYEGRVHNLTKRERESLNDQQESYAKTYLESIGRQAPIGDYSDIDRVLLTDMGVSVEVSNKLLGLKVNYDTGTVGWFEEIENGVRYIYRTSYSENQNLIIYTKENYETKEVVEKIEVDSLTGNVISAQNVPSYSKWFDAEVTEVDRDINCISVKPFENTEERKIGESIFVSLDTIDEDSLPDLYEGLYIRIFYDGKIEKEFSVKIENPSAIYLYADMNYVGNQAPQTENNNTVTFDATVIDVDKNGAALLVTPFEGANERKSCDKIWVSAKDSGLKDITDIKPGINLRIIYDGQIQETYPAQINGVHAIYLHSELPDNTNKQPTTRAYYITE